MSKAFETAVRLLSLREHGAQELLQKIIKKGHTEVEAQEALMQCQTLDLQNDKRYVECIYRTRLHQGYGPIKIRHDLQSKHIDSELISDILAHDNDQWVDYALETWKKKFGKQNDTSYIAIQKQKQFLLYRGFSTDTINMVFKLKT